MPLGEGTNGNLWYTHTQVTEITASHLRKLGEEGCLEKDIRKESQKKKKNQSKGKWLKNFLLESLIYVVWETCFLISTTWFCFETPKTQKRIERQTKHTQIGKPSPAEIVGWPLQEDGRQYGLEHRLGIQPTSRRWVRARTGNSQH